MVKQQKNLIYLVLVMLISLLFTSCNGSNIGATIDKNARLSLRLDSYIDARKHPNLGKLQQLYLIPEQARIGKIIVKKCTIVAINIDDDGLHAETKLENKIQAMGFTFAKVPMTVKWVWNENDWYIEPPENSGNPFTKKNNASGSD